MLCKTVYSEFETKLIAIDSSKSVKNTDYNKKLFFSINSQK